ncbi:hypothetical protein D3C81_1401610 [compost metagenome]
MNRRGGADVHAPCRVGSDQQLGGLKDFAAEDELLQVATGQAACRGPCIRGLDREALDDLLGQRLHLARADQAAVDQAVLKSGEQGVVGQAHVRHRAVPKALGRYECHPQGAAGVGEQVGHRPVVEGDAFALASGQACFTTEQGQQFVLAVAGNPRDADDLAAAHFQAQVFEGRAERVLVAPGQVVHAQTWQAPGAFRVACLKPFGIADHHPRQLQIAALRRAASAGDAAAAQHRGTVA